MNQISESNEKTKFLDWAIKWLKYPVISNNQKNIDASELASLLQCIGFSLDSFKTSPEQSTDESNLIRIVITCSRSGMQANLSKNFENSPTLQNIANVENNNGYNSENANDINIINNIILPNASPKKDTVVNALTNKILLLIEEPDDKILDNAKPKLLLTPSVQLNSLPLLETPNSPRSTSSPLQTPDKDKKTQGFLKKIIKLAEDALALDKNTTYTKNSSKKRISDIKRSPEIRSPKPLTGAFINVSKNASIATPKKIAPAKKSIAQLADDKKKMFQIPSKIGLMRKKPNSPLPKTPSKLTPKRIDTPRPNSCTPIDAPVGVSKLRVPTKSSLPKKK